MVIIVSRPTSLEEYLGSGKYTKQDMIKVVKEYEVITKHLDNQLLLIQSIIRRIIIRALEVKGPKY